MKVKHMPIIEKQEQGKVLKQCEILAMFGNCWKYCITVYCNKSKMNTLISKVITKENKTMQKQQTNKEEMEKNFKLLD